MEYRELYDENRQPLGIAITKSDPVPPNAYMLTVGIWIVNDQKQILLTRRSFEKRYAPGMWENPAGHVQKGETCEDAIIRRAYADVYIHIPADELERRLRGRQTDAEEVILLRLRNAAEEDARMGEYQFALVSADRESDYARFTALLTTLGMRTGL